LVPQIRDLRFLSDVALSACHLPVLLEVALALENYAKLLRETNRQMEATAMEVRAKAIRAKQAK